MQVFTIFSLFSFLNFAIFHSSAANNFSTSCSTSKCNSTDPNCDVQKQKCKTNYRMCCDSLCHKMSDLCSVFQTSAEDHRYEASNICDGNKCNSTDPNCDAIGRRCKSGFRMCCDGLCRDKQDSCDSEKLTHYSFLQDLNENQYRTQLQKIKEYIKQYLAENPCWPIEKCLNKTTCNPGYLHCDNGQCVRLLLSCPMWWEKNDFSSPSNKTCYPSELCFRNQCRMQHWMCDNGECVHEQVVCRGGPDCSDGSDEKFCSGKCYPPFRCNNNTCRFGFFSCSNGKCILHEQVCDTVRDCPAGEDERNCSTECYPQKACNPDNTCKRGYFRCDKTKCIPDSNLCDQRKNCDDGTDEIKSGPGFKCVLGSNYDTCLVSQQYVKNGVPECNDHADICIVNNTDRCFTCLDQRLVISEKQRCDGVFDCYDLSDECFCDNSPAQETCKSICLDINSNSSHHHDWFPLELSSFLPRDCNCSHGLLDCGNGMCLSVNKICDGIEDCGSTGLDEKYCQLVSKQKIKRISCPGDAYNMTTINAAMCDGRPECHDLSDECNEQCDTVPRFCNIKTLFNSDKGPYEFLCDRTSLYFDVRAICNGRWTKCNPQIEEEELDCPSRHYCKSGEAISIDINLLCDGIPQCDDASDEKNCSDRFYCENKIPISVPISKKFDGRPDCSDFSDECPSDMDKKTFSSRYEMLESVGFRCVTWIIGSTALLGNLITFIGAVKSLIQDKNLNRVSQVSNIFLLNLAVADCLMGFYLLNLLIKSLHFSGNYCEHDKIWRTSSGCSQLGGLALISSQTSVFILICLTSLRLYSVLNPTKGKRISSLMPHAVMLLVWIVSIALAVLPVFPVFADYFVSDIWMPTNFTNMEYRDKNSLALFVHRLSCFKPLYSDTYERHDHFHGNTWHELTAYLERFYPGIEVKGFFGYFSDNSFCLPRFFVFVGEAGWEYSIAIIIFNFLAFLYICFAYWTIYRASSGQQARKKRSRQLASMQKRISRLVITDFCCWVPICILSFVQLARISLPDQAYAYCAVILLPINSAINPFLYSTTLARPLEQLFYKIFAKQNSNILPLCLLSKRENLPQTRTTQSNLSRIRSDKTEEKSV